MLEEFDLSAILFELKSAVAARGERMRESRDPLSRGCASHWAKAGAALQKVALEVDSLILDVERFEDADANGLIAEDCAHEDQYINDRSEFVCRDCGEVLGR